LALASASACRKGATDDPPGAASGAPSTVAGAAPSVSAFVKEPPLPEKGSEKKAVSIDVSIGGDAIPQVKVLANEIEDIVASIPSCFKNADARVLNLEAPVGERAGLPGDKSILAFASPPAWFGKLNASSKASAFVVANNHACDLGPEGLASTVREAKTLNAPIAGADESDPWKRVDFVEKDGRHVCMVAWTTFLNDKGRKQKGCLEGSAGAKVARAELGRKGLDLIHEQLSAPGRWDGCDARIAYIHGGREYRPQIRPVLEQAQAASAYVDAVIVSHPHVPDQVEAIRSPAVPAGRDANAAGGRKEGRSVPVFKSLGNFISNQGIAWTLGMSVELLDVDGVPDPIRTVWTRVAMIARLHFGWEPNAPEHAAPTTVLYGYTLAFTDRAPPVQIRLRPLPNGPDDAVAAKLRKGPHPFSNLLDDRCRVDEGAAPTCDGLSGAAVASANDSPASPGE
jgi:poly-gamma-glutamate capsule biosynthesis protein CapA/YwtB (metallophosphatase superfamily)